MPSLYYVSVSRGQQRAHGRRSSRGSRTLGLAALVAVTCWLESGCVPSLVKADIARQGWLEVDTVHVSLRTDLGRDQAVARATQLERYWQALAATYALVLPGAPPPSTRLVAIHFQSCADFDAVRGNQDAVGFAYTSRDVSHRTIAVTCERPRPADQVLLHELAHLFNHHDFPGLPVWLEEGLATYYETMKVQGGKAVLGGFPRDFPARWAHWVWLPDVTALRRMSYAEFHDDSERRHYFAAWKLVHLLNNSSNQLHAAFQQYLGRLARGAPEADAWSATFGRLTGVDLDRRFREYQFSFEIRMWTTAYRWTSPGPPRIRRLRPGEADALWADLLFRLDPGAAAAQMKRAAAADPDWPALRYWQGILRPPGPAAVATLRAYCRHHPRDPRGWQALVEAELDVISPSGEVPTDAATQARLAAIDRDVVALVEHATSPVALNTIAWYFALRHIPATGLNFAIRALQADPRCAACWDTAGLLYFQDRKVNQALAAQERSLGLYTDHVPREVLERLRQYRAAAGAVRRTHR